MEALYSRILTTAKSRAIHQVPNHMSIVLKVPFMHDAHLEDHMVEWMSTQVLDGRAGAKCQIQLLKQYVHRFNLNSRIRDPKLKLKA